MSIREWTVEQGRAVRPARPTCSSLARHCVILVSRRASHGPARQPVPTLHISRPATGFVTRKWTETPVSHGATEPQRKRESAVGGNLVHRPNSKPLAAPCLRASVRFPCLDPPRPRLTIGNCGSGTPHTRSYGTRTGSSGPPGTMLTPGDTVTPSITRGSSITAGSCSSSG